MNTHKFFTLATLLAVALGSVAMAENVILSGDDHREKGAGNSIAEAVADAKKTYGYEIADGASFAIWANTTESDFTNINRSNITVIGSTTTAPVISGSTARIFKSENSDYAPKSKTMFLQNLVFSGNSSSAAVGGGVIYISGDNFTITGKNVTFENNTAPLGGALAFNGGTITTTFEGNDSKITFKGNKADGVANDIYDNGTLKFQGTGEYSFNGGITGDAVLTIDTGAKLSFLTGASNQFKSLSISGTETKASFASGTTTQAGATTIQDTTAGNVTFDGNQTFTGDVTVSNAGNATFGSGSESTGALLTITDDTSKVVFQGTQQFTKMLIEKGATAEIDSTAKFNNTATTVTGQGSKATVANGATFTNSSIIVDNRGELTIADSFNSPTATITAQNGGVVDLNSSGDFTFTGNLAVNNGGVVNFNGGNTSKLTVEGNLSGSNGDLNLAIQKTATKSMTDGKYDVEGQTLEAMDLSGENFITVSAPDFKYHEETGMFAILTSDTSMTLGDFYDAFNLPFAWFASVDDEDFSFINQDLSATGDGTFYIFKVDGDKVPEPSTWALLILGSVGLYFIRRKKTAK